MKPPRFGGRMEYVDKKADTNVAKVTNRARKSAGFINFFSILKKFDGRQNQIDLYRDFEK